MNTKNRTAGAQAENQDTAVQTSGPAAAPPAAAPARAGKVDPDAFTGSGVGADRSDHIATTKVPATVLPVDEFHGKGGDYVIGTDGVRRPANPETVPPAAA
jgi:hypothetical protein